MNSLLQRWHEVRHSIQAFEQRYHRTSNSVTLLAVSKKQSLEDIQTLFGAGQDHFGENYLDEALEKIVCFEQTPPLWHYIGEIQSRKCEEIADNFSWVHSLSRDKEAIKLNKARGPDNTPLQVCIQVNLERVDNKSGVLPEDLSDLIHTVQEQPHLKLRGFMTLPEPKDQISDQRVPFKALRELLETWNEQGLGLDTLSMGTSHDYEAAIAEGATIIRLGESLFGPRN